MHLFQRTNQGGSLFLSHRRWSLNLNRCMITLKRGPWITNRRIQIYRIILDQLSNLKTYQMMNYNGSQICHLISVLEPAKIKILVRVWDWRDNSNIKQPRCFLRWTSWWDSCRVHFNRGLGFLEGTKILEVTNSKWEPFQKSMKIISLIQMISKWTRTTHLTIKKKIKLTKLTSWTKNSLEGRLKWWGRLIIYKKCHLSHIS